MTVENSSSSFQALLDYLKRTRGFDFSGYKTTSLQRRVQRRMQQLPMTTFEEYVDYLEVHPEEFAQLFNTILINVTDFFRDPPAWEFLQSDIIPSILERKSESDLIRVWSAGCATGQEAYSLAILFSEVLGMEAFRERVKIYATDADEEALVSARQASYSASQVQSVPERFLDKYFDRIGTRFVFRNDLRRAVIFGRHDLVQDAPISRLDLLVCRNTLMYFNAETQSRILVRLNFALNDGGFLFLGKSEMMLTRSNLFSPQSLKHRIFSKVNDSNMRDRLLEMAQVSDVEAGNHLARQIRLREAAMDSAPVAQMVLNMNSELVLINARARLMFNLSPKDLGRPLQDLEISYRPVELRSLIDQANGERRSVSLTQVQRSMPNGEIQYLDVQVVPMRHNDDALLGVTVTFTDVSDSRRLQDELRHTAHDLETAYEELQSANEELETTNEELQSANEELETTNEELQSANEELETMNEELQSSNEELRTVNDELRHRTEEFNRINSWLQSLLSVPPSGLVVMDHELRILLWNQRAEDMWGLRSDEVQGKSFFELDIGLPIHQLREPIRACFEGRQSETTLVLDAVNRRGRAIKCEVIVKMFGELGDESMGVAISMEDVTARERSIQERDEKERQFKLLLESLPFIVLAQGENNDPVFWSREAQRLTGWGVDDIVGNPRYLELLYPDDRYRAELQVELSALGDGSRSWAGKVTAKDGSSKTISWTSLSKQISVPGWKDWLIGKEVE